MSTRKILDLPRHKNPSTPDRTACAPYNFIPLPPKVVTVVEDAKDLPDHDRYHAGRHTGYLDVMLTAKSPLYVRCPFTRDEFDLDEQDMDRNGSKVDSQTRYPDRIKNTPHFFYTRDPNQPVIPGSSLRGMLRGILEIVSYGKMDRVTDKKLFFRTLDTSLGREYVTRMMDPAGNGGAGNGYRPRVEAGFVRKSGDDWSIEPCTFARVEMEKVAEAYGIAVRGRDGSIDRNRTIENLYTNRGPSGKPHWQVTTGGSTAPLQHSKVFLITEPRSGDYLHSRGRYLRYLRVNQIRTSATGAANEREGILVLTGPIQNQHMAFVFLPQNPATRLPIPNHRHEDDINKRLVDLFHDGDQLTPWQEQMFEKNKPPGANRSNDGYLRNGEPIFFLRERGRLIFFGRAQMFRLPYTRRPVDLVPGSLCCPEDIDYADALFGFVRTRQELEDTKKHSVVQDIPKQGSKRRAYSGRVFVTDARTAETDVSMPRNPVITPRILATPKPTAFQHYLTQKEPELYPSGRTRNDGSPILESRLRHYDSETPSETVIRGYKRYWHQGELSLDDIHRRIEEERETLRKIADDESNGKGDKQHTQFKPVKPGVTFTFRVYFENLSEEELGALCWTLHPLGDETMMNDPNRGYHHSLGMGKPLGMGAVTLEATLHLADRPKRYGSLFEGDNWQTGAAGAGESLSNIDTLKARTQKFEGDILRQLDDPRKPSGGECKHLRDLRRIGMLLRMMEWPGYPAEAARPDQPSPNNRILNDGRPNTRYMTIELLGVHGSAKNEYRDRPVLPDPEAFGDLTGYAEPTSGSSGPQVDPPTSSPAPSTTDYPSGPPSPDASSSSAASASKGSPQLKTKMKKPEPKRTSTTKKERVTIVDDVRQGKAQVRTEQGESIQCSFPLFMKGGPQQRCRAEVRREDGKAVRAVFDKWE